jgi:hypothetical protein
MQLLFLNAFPENAFWSQLLAINQESQIVYWLIPLQALDFEKKLSGSIYINARLIAE